MTDDTLPASIADANRPESDGVSSGALWVGLLVGVALLAALCVVLALVGWRVGAAPAA